MSVAALKDLKGQNQRIVSIITVLYLNIQIQSSSRGQILRISKANALKDIDINTMTISSILDINSIVAETQYEDKPPGND